MTLSTIGVWQKRAKRTMSTPVPISFQPFAPMPTRPAAPPGVYLSCCAVSVADPTNQPWTEMLPQIMGPKSGDRNVDRNRAPKCVPNFVKTICCFKTRAKLKKLSVPPFGSTVKAQFRSTFGSPTFGARISGHNWGHARAVCHGTSEKVRRRRF